MTDVSQRRWAKLAVSLLVAGCALWLIHAGALPVLPGAQAFSGVKWWAPVAYLLIWSVVHVLRAVRWHWLLLPIQRVRLGTLFCVAFIGFAAVVALPLRSGELVRPLLLGRRTGVSSWAAAGTVAAERIVDGLVLSLLLLLALRLAGPTQGASVVPGLARAAVGMFLGAFVLMGAFYWRRELARRLIERSVGVISRPFACWVAERLARTADGLRFLPSLRNTGPFLLLTAAYWLLNGAAAWLLARGVGFDNATFWQGSVIIGVLALGILIPNAPGFFGTFQASVYAALALYYQRTQVEQAGAAFVLIIYASQLAITFGAGAGSMVLARLTVRDALAISPIQADSG
jgi:uncharacterized protein (TIRG00374 family)